MCVDYLYIDQPEEKKLPFFMKYVRRPSIRTSQLCTLHCSELSIFWVEQRLSSCLPWEELLPSSFIRAAFIMLMTLLLFHLPFSRPTVG